MKSGRWLRVGFAWLVGLGTAAVVGAQTTVAAPSIVDWLSRVHRAASQQAYAGTFVVMVGNTFSSAKIVHAFDGQHQLEQVVSLSGTQRMTYRRNAHVVTFFPLSRKAVVETRESLELFSDRLRAADSSIERLYQFHPSGTERIAGFEADVVRLVPKDRWRYGFTVWSERNSGLVLQVRIHDLEGRVLEQAAFSELQMNAVVDKAAFIRAMEQTEGYAMERPALQPANPQDHGWVQRQVIEGFRPVRCYQRPSWQLAGDVDVGARTALQWVFSDGLANVSLFMEPFDAKRHLRQGAAAIGGATHTVARRADGWWLTAVGEVPVATLNAFVRGLERTK